MRLLLIRHGQSEGNAARRIQGQGDYPLSALGHEQAHRLAGRLRREYEGLSAVYTSTLRRAAQTAVILAEAVGAPLVLDERLQEHDIGELAGLTAQEVQERFPEFHAAWMADPEEWIDTPGGEGSERLGQRVREVMAEIAARHGSDETVAIVSHGGTLGAYLGQVLGLPPNRRPPFYFANASLSVVDLARRRPRLVQHNDTCHLADVGGGR